MNSPYPWAISRTQRRMPNPHTHYSNLSTANDVSMHHTYYTYHTTLTRWWRSYANTHHTLIFLIAKYMAQTYVCNTSCHFLANLFWMLKVVHMVLSLFCQKINSVWVIHTFFKISNTYIQKYKMHESLWSNQPVSDMDLPTWWSPEWQNVLQPMEDQWNYLCLNYRQISQHTRYHCILIAYSLQFCFGLLCLALT